MDIEKIKALAGLRTDSGVAKQCTKVSKTFDNIKISEEVDFRILVKKFGAAAVYETRRGNTVAVVEFDDKSLEASQEKMDAFSSSWENVQNGEDGSVTCDNGVCDLTEEYSVSTWFERDRANVTVEDADGNEVASWWDEDVQQLVDDGFLNPKDWEGSAISYAKYLGLIENSVMEEKDEVLYGLYVGDKGSGTLGIQFTGTRKECQQEWQDTKHTWKNAEDKGKKVVYRIQKVEDEKQITISESYVVQLCERKMTDEQKAKREQIVKAMKADTKGLKERYGKDWKSVMYATATKQALEESDQRVEILKRHIAHAEEQQRSLDRASVSWKDWEAQKKRWLQELQNLDNEKVTEADNFTQPTTDSTMDNDVEKRTGTDVERNTKIVVPKKVKNDVAARITELKKSIEQYDEKGYNDNSEKEKAIECLQQLMDNLESNDLVGLKQAQVFYGTLMSPITDLFPASIVNFLANPDVYKEKTSKWLDKLK